MIRVPSRGRNRPSPQRESRDAERVGARPSHARSSHPTCSPCGWSCSDPDQRIYQRPLGGRRHELPRRLPWHGYTTALAPRVPRQSEVGGGCRRTAEWIGAGGVHLFDEHLIECAASPAAQRTSVSRGRAQDVVAEIVCAAQVGESPRQRYGGGAVAARVDGSARAQSWSVVQVSREGVRQNADRHLRTIAGQCDDHGPIRRPEIGGDGRVGRRIPFHGKGAGREDALAGDQQRQDGGERSPERQSLWCPAFFAIGSSGTGMFGGVRPHGRRR